MLFSRSGRGGLKKSQSAWHFDSFLEDREQVTEDGVFVALCGARFVQFKEGLW